MKPEAKKLVAKALLDAANALSASSGSATLRVWHGTDAMFDDFDLSKAGSRDPGWLGRGLYFSTDPRVVQGFKRQVQAIVRLKNPLMLKMPDWKTDKFNVAREALGLPFERGITDAGARALTAEAQRRGFDGVILDYSPAGYFHQEVVAFHPKSVTITSSGPVSASSQVARKDNVRPRGTFVSAAADALSASGPERWAYHLTYKDDLQSIKSKGLVPQADTSEAWGAEPGIYFVDTPGYEAGPTFDPDYMVWLRFPWPSGVPFSKNTMSEYRTTDAIPAKEIQVWSSDEPLDRFSEEDGWTSLSSNALSAASSVHLIFEDGDDTEALFEQAHDLFEKQGIYLHNGYDRFFVLIDDADDERVAATAAMCLYDTDEPPSVEFSVAVAPDQQRKGLAKKLVEEVIRYTKQASTEFDWGDDTEVEAYVVNDKAMVPLLRSLGFEPSSSDPKRWRRKASGSSVTASVEGTVKRIMDKASKANSYEEFLQSTDGEDCLYRGSSDQLSDNVFMTDYVGHAASYAENGMKDVDGIVVDLGTVLYFDDNTFDKMRKEGKYNKSQIKKLYEGHQKLYVTDKSISSVMRALSSDKPYSELIPNIQLNDMLIPVMQEYAKKKGYNIISFLGTDYGDYGGQNEFVVSDISRYPKLSDIWNSAKSSAVSASSQVARKDNGRPRGTFVGSADGWEYTEGYPLGLRGGWAASIGLSSSNNWMNLSVEGATEYDEGFRNALREIVAEYPEITQYVVSFDGPYIPVSELLEMKSKDFRDIVFLHGTSSAVVPRIMAEGLRPRSETGIEPAYGHASSAKPSIPDRVYLTTQPAMATFAARSAARVHGGEPVVLEVTGLDPSYALPDEDSRAQTAEESLARLGSIAYSRTIPKSNISVSSKELRAVLASADADSFLDYYGLKGLLEGKLVKLYHGTTAHFSKFDLTKARDELVNRFYGKGIFLTPSKKVAWEYAFANRNIGFPKTIIDDLKSVNRNAGSFLQFLYENGDGEDEWELYLKDNGLWIASPQPGQGHIDLDRVNEHFGGIDGNTISDIAEHIIGSASARNRKSSEVEEVMNFFNPSTGAPSYVYDLLDEVGLDSSKYRPKVFTVVVKVKNTLVTDSQSEARSAQRDGYDSVVYYGPDTVEDVPEVAVYDASLVKVVDVEVST